MAYKCQKMLAEYSALIPKDMWTKYSALKQNHVALLSTVSLYLELNNSSCSITQGPHPSQEGGSEKGDLRAQVKMDLMKQLN